MNIRTITFGHLPSYLTSMFEDLIMQQMSSDHYKDPYEPISVMEALTIHVYLYMYLHFTIKIKHSCRLNILYQFPIDAIWGMSHVC